MTQMVRQISWDLRFVFNKYYLEHTVKGCLDTKLIICSLICQIWFTYGYCFEVFQWGFCWIINFSTEYVINSSAQCLHNFVLRAETSGCHSIMYASWATPLVRTSRLGNCGFLKSCQFKPIRDHHLFLNWFCLWKIFLLWIT